MRLTCDAPRREHRPLNLRLALLREFEAILQLPSRVRELQALPRTIHAAPRQQSPDISRRGVGVDKVGHHDGVELRRSRPCVAFAPLTFVGGVFGVVHLREPRTRVSRIQHPRISGGRVLREKGKGTAYKEGLPIPRERPLGRLARHGILAIRNLQPPSAPVEPDADIQLRGPRLLGLALERLRPVQRITLRLPTMRHRMFSLVLDLLLRAAVAEAGADVASARLEAEVGG